MKKKEIEHIESQLAEATFLGISELFSNLYEELNNWKLNDSDYYLVEYFKGMTCYLNPDREEFRLLQSLKHFEKAIKLNSKHVMSLLHRAYCYYDTQNYQKAAHEFSELLDKELYVFLSNDQEWRVANIMEFYTLCSLHLRQIPNFIKKYQIWKGLYYEFILKTKDNYYFPRDMVMQVADFLKKNGENLSPKQTESFKSISVDLIGFIRGGEGFDEIYKKELDNLKNWSGQKTLSSLKQLA